MAQLFHATQKLQKEWCTTKHPIKTSCVIVEQWQSRLRLHKEPSREILIDTGRIVSIVGILFRLTGKGVAEGIAISKKYLAAQRPITG